MPTPPLTATLSYEKLAPVTKGVRSSLRRAAAMVTGRVMSGALLERLARLRGVSGIVFNYHTIRLQAMREHLAALDEFFDVVPLDDVVDRVVRPGARVRKPLAAVTVDDGKRSHATQIAPALRERGWHGTFFVTSGRCADGGAHWFDLSVRIGQALERVLASGDSERLRLWLAQAPWREEVPEGLETERLKRLTATRRDSILHDLCERLGVDRKPVDDDEAPLTPEEVGELDRQGFTVGSHSVTHPILVNESPERAWAEIADSRAQIAGWIGKSVRHFSYPNGTASDQTEVLTRRAGYDAAWVTDPLWCGTRENRHRLPRVQIYEEEDRAEMAFKVVRALLGTLSNPDGSGYAYLKRRAASP